MDQDNAERNMQDKFQRAAEDLEIIVETPFCLVLDGVEVRSLALFRNFGAPNGTVLFLLGPRDKAEDLGEKTRLLKRHGYTVSISGDNRSAGRNSYNRESFIEMLREWGWNGAKSKEPRWLRVDETGI